MKRSLLVVLAFGCTAALLFGGAAKEGPASRPAGPLTLAAGDGPLARYSSPVVIYRVGVSDPSVEYIDGESVEDHVVVRKNLEVLNIQYKTKWIVDVTQLEQKLNLAVASNDLPDVFTAGRELLGRLIAADQVADLQPVYEAYASPKLREMLSFADGIGFQASTLPDGRIMGLPLTQDFAGNVTLLWIRDDWLRKLGRAAPRTEAEFVDLVRAFVRQDPDGDGKNDTYGIAVDKALGMEGLMSPLDGVGHMYGAYGDIWVDVNGHLEYSGVQPAMRRTLELLQTVYREGLLDPEFAVKDTTRIAEDLGQEKVGIYFGPHSAPLYPLLVTRENNPASEWKGYPLVADAAGRLRPKARSPVNEWVVVRKGFDHPEAVVKSMNLWREIWLGDYFEWWLDLQKGAYAPVVESMHGYALPALFESPLKNVNVGRDVRKAVDTGDESGMPPESANIMRLIATGAPIGWAAKEVFYGAEYILDVVYKDYYYDRFNGLPTNAFMAYKSNLDKMMLESFVKVIMGAPIETFDEFVQRWKDLGGAEMTREADAWYQTRK